MFNKLKQIKELSQKANQLKKLLADEKVEATTDWGKIKIIMNGNMQIVSLDIDPELLSPDKKTKLQEGLQSALNDVLKKAGELAAKKMQSLGGLDMSMFQ